tara:strand:- start:2290 stop:2919 length:630 start_codon:yes stop_codon:yes gene_type:complete
MIIHQIFYDFSGKNEPMPQLYKTLQEKVKKFSKRNNYTYKFWNKSMIDKLINKYARYKPLLNNVRYEIMRVDMVKFLILYDSGGLYLDMDIQPKLNKLKDYDLAFASTGKKFNVDVIQSKKGNPLLLSYLDYVKEQINEKSKIDIYWERKFRFVLHTTGPNALTRWIKKEKINPNTYRVNDATTNPPQLNLIGNEDFQDYPSGYWAKNL